MRLLIVDDSKMILKQAEDILKTSDANCEILLAKSGEEAFEILNDVRIDIVVLDIIMPGISGIEVLRKIKLDNELKKIKVLMFSSLMDKKTLQQCFEIGAIDYITKPLEKIEFLARVKSVIKEKALENEILDRAGGVKSINLDSELAVEFIELLKNMELDVQELKKYFVKYNLLIELYQTYKNEIELSNSNESKAVLETINNYENKNKFPFIHRTIEDTLKNLERNLNEIKGFRT